MKENILAVPSLIHNESPAILTCMIALHRHYRRIVLVPCPPRITDVHIERISITVELPQSGHRHLVPSFDSVLRLEEIKSTVFKGFIPFEIPFPIKTQIHAPRIEGRGHRISVYLHNTRFLPCRKI